jgi:SAM-dependent methyltransferase
MSRRMKSLYYAVASPAMRVNSWLYRRWRAPRNGVAKVHLGPGKRNYLAGWVNVDANMFTGKCDVWANLDDGLPFPDSSVDAIYSHHVIEHLKNLAGHFAEMFRILKPGGVFRVGGPNGDMAIRKYVAGDNAWFDDYPDKRASLGGRFENFIFCRQEHLTILTPSYLEELAMACGFQSLALVKPIVESRHPDTFDQKVLALEWESTPDEPHTLLMEGEKPQT